MSFGAPGAATQGGPLALTFWTLRREHPDTLDITPAPSLIHQDHGTLTHHCGSWAHHVQGDHQVPTTRRDLSWDIRPLGNASKERKLVWSRPRKPAQVVNEMAHLPQAGDAVLGQA